MRVAIVGSRDWSDEERVHAYVRSLPEGTTVVSGGAIGPDSWAAHEARRCGLAVITFLPDWKTHGRAAGMIRNSAIVEACDLLVAFWRGASRGTADSVGKARRAGKPFEIFTEPG